MTPREAFVAQSVGCARLGSPFMARLMDLMAERLDRGTAVGARILGWPGDPSPNADNVPLRLAGALHALKLEGLALSDVYPPNDVPDDLLWQAVLQALADHGERLLAWLGNAPQTNEVRRAAALLPGLAALARVAPGPVALFELGTSGGLNLRADCFRLDLPGATMGADSSPVRLTPEWRGALPPLDLPPVTGRRGVDLNPLDPASAAGRLRLLAYLWPDQTDRLQRTKAAIGIARAVPAAVDKGDAGQWLAAALAVPPPGGARAVVCHTIAWQYFPAETRQKAEDAIARAPFPVARLSVEADGDAGAAIRLAPEQGAEARLLGRADFHGRWIDWH